MVSPRADDEPPTPSQRHGGAMEEPTYPMDLRTHQLPVYSEVTTASRPTTPQDNTFYRLLSLLHSTT